MHLLKNVDEFCPNSFQALEMQQSKERSNMEDVLVQLEGGVEQGPDLVLKLVDNLRFGNLQYIIEFFKTLEKDFRDNSGRTS